MMELEAQLQAQIEWLQNVKTFLKRCSDNSKWQAAFVADHEPSSKTKKMMKVLLEKQAGVTGLLPNYQDQIMNTLTNELQDGFRKAFSSVNGLKFDSLSSVFLSHRDNAYLCDGWLFNDEYRLTVTINDVKYLFNVRVNLPHQVKIVYDFPRRNVWVPLPALGKDYRLKSFYGNLTVKLLEVENPHLKAVYDHGEIRDAATVYQEAVDNYRALGYFDKLKATKPGSFENWYQRAVKPDSHYVGDVSLKQQFIEDETFRKSVLSQAGPQLKQLETSFNQFWVYNLGYNAIQFGKVQVERR